MVNANMLKGFIATNGLTIEKMARDIGINPATFYKKINGQSDFYCHEIVDICRILHIKDPIPIFLPKNLRKRKKLKT